MHQRLLELEVGSRKRLPEKQVADGREAHALCATAKDSVCCPRHNVLRQAMLAFGQPVDHLGNVVVVLDPDFDIKKTIFHTLDSRFAQFMIVAKNGNTLQWNEDRAQQVSEACEAYVNKVPAPVGDAFQLKAIMEFMHAECDLKMEHADGSFLDHLDFCRDFSALYMPHRSPRILFLHSIMGTATNHWPMAAEKIPQLQALVDPEEFRHIAAFPTVLRMIKATDLLPDLYRMGRTGEKKHGIRFKRALDGSDLYLSMEELWTHLNFHLVHALDFLPAAGWSTSMKDPFMQEFCDLYCLLRASDKLECGVALPEQIKTTLDSGAASLGELHELDAALNAGMGGEGDPTQGLRKGFGGALLRRLPKRVLRGAQTKNIRKFSDKASVSLEYAFDAGAQVKGAGAIVPEVPAAERSPGHRRSRGLLGICSLRRR